jgi:hypothetical protein
MKKGSGRYDKDERFYITLDDASDNVKELYSLDERWMECHHQCMIRILLWYCIYFNCPREAFNMPEFVGQTRTLLFSGTVDNDCDNLSSADPHLYIEKPSVIIGGYQGTYTQCLSHQPCHFDISDITIDGEDYPVSKNPRLKNLAKPGSFWLPLHDYRCIMFRRLNSLQRVKVDCGSCVVFSGDTPHCGETHVPALYSSYTWHPCLHIYIMSKHHEVNLGKFDVDVDGIMLFQPEHISQLSVENQNKGTRNIVGRLVNVT